MKHLLTILLLACSSSFAINEYYSLSKSIRSQGMGGAFFGLSDDEYALFSNPAGLSLRNSGTEVMLRLNGHVSSNAISGFSDFKNLDSLNIKQAIDLLDKYKDKPLQGNAGILPYFLTRNLAIGILLADTKLNFNIYKSAADIGALLPSDVVADLTFLSDSGLVVGYAHSVLDPNFHIGANLKGIFRAGGRQPFTAQQYFAENSIDFDPKQIGGSGFGIDLDLGATYEFTNLPFGVASRASIVLQNILATQFTYSKQYAGAPGLVRTANVGWYTVFEGVSIIDNFHLLADISDIPMGGEDDKDFGARNTGSFFKKVHLGVEIPMGRFSVRAGLNQGYLTAGLGLNLYALRIDLATYGEDIGDTSKIQSRRYAVTAAIGWGSAPAAPRTSRIKEEKVPAVPKQEVIPEPRMEPEMDPQMDPQVHPQGEPKTEPQGKPQPKSGDKTQKGDSVNSMKESTQSPAKTLKK
ncbi:MAG: hypothetical protein ACKOA8_16860, partial [Deltaproteobacteria bacterium]